MSVQFGMWNFDGQPVDRNSIAACTESLRRHGPDGESWYLKGSIALAHCPFHTTRESRREKQPHSSRRGFIVTLDGRLDNRNELMSDLSDDLEADSTDVAIVAASFDRWETDCFRRIIGDWSVSVWNPERREVVLAVDYMGIRHIFYCLKAECISWSSDLTALLLLSEDKLHIDDHYISGYLAHDPDAQLTPYREIREVPPGKFMCVRDGGTIIKRHWSFSPKLRICYKTDHEYEEHFRHVFRQSVRRRLRSDSPVLADLSGGLDSSSIVCMADDILANDGPFLSRLDTLSYCDETEPNGDDQVYIRMIERNRGRIGAHIDASTLTDAPTALGPSEFSPLPGRSGLFDELHSKRSSVLRAGGYRVTLSGIGGDEFLGGIPDPREQLADLIVQFRPISLAKHLIAWSLVKRRPWVQLLGQALIELIPVRVRQHFAKEAKVESWINKDFARRTMLPLRLLGADGHSGFWLPTRRSYMDGVLLMANKMAKSAPPPLTLEETRYPFLDQNVIEFVLAIPATQLLRPGERRSLMRRSLRSIVPKEVLSRRTKQLGARTPIRALLRHVEELQVVFASSLSSSLGYVNQADLTSVLQSLSSGKDVHLVRLMRTISLEFWLRDLVSRSLIDVVSPTLPDLIGGSWPHARDLTI